MRSTSQFPRSRSENVDRVEVCKRQCVRSSENTV